MWRDDDDGVEVPLSSSAKALEGKQLHAREQQKQRRQKKELKQKRDLLKLKVAVKGVRKDDAPDTFGTKTIEQIVEKQMQAAAEKTPKPEEMIHKEEEKRQAQEQRRYEEQQQIG